MKRARMKAGHRPIIVDCAFVPEHPTYWAVPESASAAVELLVEAGQVEYEPSLARGAGGLFTGPAVQLAPVAASPAPFARRGKGRG